MTETKQPETNILHIGIDVGSTTVKLAVLNDANEILWAVYRRHHADVRATVLEVLKEAAAQYPTQDFTVAITGSGGLPRMIFLSLRKRLTTQAQSDN